jgi:hypothetical protein
MTPLILQHRDGGLFNPKEFQHPKLVKLSADYATNHNSIGTWWIMWQDGKIIGVCSHSMLMVTI